MEITGLFNVLRGGRRFTLLLLCPLLLFLKLGQSVNLEGFGSFRASVSSEGTATPEELNARHIKGVKLLFCRPLTLNVILKV
jgi:hypothetical protein